MNTYRVITTLGADIDVECDDIEISDNGDLKLYKGGTPTGYLTLAAFADGSWIHVYRKDVTQQVAVSKEKEE